MQEIHISMQERIFHYVLTIDDVIDSTVMHVNYFPRPIPIPVPIPIHQQGLIPNIDNYFHTGSRTRAAGVKTRSPNR